MPAYEHRRTDAARDFKTLRNMVSGFGLTYPVIHDELNRIGAPFRIVGYPTSFVIDRTSTLRWRAAALATAVAE
ncbi:hypothetical protein [Nannocystis pusilla]|uniref:hypothetical protein n=1 Tax=Nannocystis pusilla TaxID=889268 RepID=UPI003B78B483